MKFNYFGIFFKSIELNSPIENHQKLQRAKALIPRRLRKSVLRLQTPSRRKGYPKAPSGASTRTPTRARRRRSPCPDGHQEVDVLPGPPRHHPHPFPRPDLSLYPIPRPSAFHQVPSHTLNAWESQEARGAVGRRLRGRGLGPPTRRSRWTAWLRRRTPRRRGTALP